MKNKSQLTDFYYKSLYPILKKLDEDRKNLQYRIVLIISFFSLIYGVLFFYILGETDGGGNALLFGGVGYVAIVRFIYKFSIKDYTAEFKNTIIRPLITAIEPNLSYSADRHIPEHLFNRSELFARPDKLTGNDFVKGIIDGVPLQFSDLHAQKRHEDSKGNVSWSTVFKGLFIVAEFNKHFKSKTIILPDSAQSMFGDFIGSWLQANNFSQDSLVKMDNVEFEKEFVVYGDNQVEARYILSHTLMQKLLVLKKRSKHKVYISFVGENINIVIDYDKDLFEPTVFKSLLEYNVAMEYVDTLHMAIGIVKELKLNEKLWSKE